MEHDEADLNKVRSSDVGTLGVLHLKRLWASALPGGMLRPPREGHMDQFVLDGLELSVVDTMQYLNWQKPAFADFEAWILEKRGGRIAAETRDKINRAVVAFLDGRHRVYPLPVDTQDRVFNKDDWACWEDNGYVVLSDAVPRDDCIALEQTIWNHLGMHPEKPEAWLARERMFWINDFHHPLMDKNRRSRRIHQAYTEIWGTDELFLTVDQLSFNPPVADERRQFGPSNIHWDASIAQPMPFDVLGVLYLNDVDENQGAFQCVPGFHRKIGAWLDALPNGTDPRKEILGAFTPVRIGGKAGDLIIWRQELPHGSSVNRGCRPRFAQYITMYPADREINPVWI